MTKPRPSRISIIPAAAVFDDRLGGADLRVLCAIAAYSDRAGKCSTATTTLAGELGVSDRRVRACLRKLEDRGYLETEHRPGLSSGYLILREPSDPGSPGSRVEGVNPGSPGSAPQEGEAPPSIPSETADEQFDEFWRGYPCRSEDPNLKQLARAKFQEKVKRGVGSWAIVQGAKNCADHIEREGVDPENIEPAHDWIERCGWVQYLVAASEAGP